MTRSQLSFCPNFPLERGAVVRAPYHLLQLIYACTFGGMEEVGKPFIVFIISDRIILPITCKCQVSALATCLFPTRNELLTHHAPSPYERVYALTFAGQQLAHEVMRKTK